MGHPADTQCLEVLLPVVEVRLLQPLLSSVAAAPVAAQAAQAGEQPALRWQAAGAGASATSAEGCVLLALRFLQGDSSRCVLRCAGSCGGCGLSCSSPRPTSGRARLAARAHGASTAAGDGWCGADHLFGGHTAGWEHIWPLLAGVYAQHTLEGWHAPADSLEAVGSQTSTARQLELDAEAAW